MYAEHYVEYYGTILAIVLALAPIVNGIYGRSLSKYTAGFTTKRRSAEIERMEFFFKSIQKARGDHQQRQVGLSYALSLIIKGWSGVVQGIVSYLLAVDMLLTSLTTVTNNISKSSGIPNEYGRVGRLLIPSANASFSFSIALAALGLFIILRSQKTLRRGLDLRDALAANPAFLDKATKRLSELTATNTIDPKRLDIVSEQIADARNYRGVDWLQLRL